MGRFLNRREKDEEKNLLKEEDQYDEEYEEEYDEEYEEEYEEDEYEEGEEDSQEYDEYEEDDDSQEEDEAEEEYDEDVFSLEEDLRREHRRQWVQYLFFAALAVVLVAGALYGSILLTNRRLEVQRTIQVVEEKQEEAPEEEPEEQLPPQPETLSYWPADLYPNVPAIESAAYETTLGTGSVQVAVPSQTSKNFDAYIDQLVEAGASLWIRTTRLSVLALDNVEIHLVHNNMETKVVLCSEDMIAWNDSGYAAFPLPQKGRLVDVREGVGAGSRVLTYRMATVLDALEYASDLMTEGWTLSGTMEPANNQLSAILKKNNLQITLDYFSTGENYQIRLDYLN